MQIILDGKDVLLKEIQEVEHHIHNREKWLGLAAIPVAETHRADRMQNTIQPFQLVSGNNVFGAWLQILGSSDTPIQSGKIKFDLHRILITQASSTRPFIIQIVSGESAEIAAKLLIEDFWEFPFIAVTGVNDSNINEIIFSRAAVGTKLWARCCDIGGNGTNISFYFGIHEYSE